MTKQEAIRRWRASAQRNIKLSNGLLEGKHYDWALFAGQLALEKLLKGLIIAKTDEVPPYTHDLKKLADTAGLTLTHEQAEDLQEISSYHIAARYDDIKKELYKKATKSYTTRWYEKIKEYIVWIKKLY